MQFFIRCSFHSSFSIFLIIYCAFLLLSVLFIIIMISCFWFMFVCASILCCVWLRDPLCLSALLCCIRCLFLYKKVVLVCSVLCFSIFYLFIPCFNLLSNFVSCFSWLFSLKFLCLLWLLWSMLMAFDGLLRLLFLYEVLGLFVVYWIGKSLGCLPYARTKDPLFLFLFYHWSLVFWSHLSSIQNIHLSFWGHLILFSCWLELNLACLDMLIFIFHFISILVFGLLVVISLFSIFLFLFICFFVFLGWSSIC